MQAKLIGTGSYLPQTVVTNDDLADRVETSDEWIRQRVGIESRRIAQKGETAAEMAVGAAKKALEMSGVLPDEIDLILVGTSTTDYLMPNMACEVQRELGIKGCPAFDIAAACSGFLYGMNVVEQYIKSGAAKNILLIGVERMSRVMDWSDRSTCVLFGDGAGAAVFTASEEPGLFVTSIHADGAHRDLLYIEGGLAETPFGTDCAPMHLKMEGNRVFKYAVNMLKDVAIEVLDKAGLTADDIDWLVPHQANERIIIATAKKLNLPMEKVVLTLAHHGNTSAASIPLALDVAVRDGRIKPGQNILLEAFGAGFVWGGALLQF